MGLMMWERVKRVFLESFPHARLATFETYSFKFRMHSDEGFVSPVPIVIDEVRECNHSEARLVQPPCTELNFSPHRPEVVSRNIITLNIQTFRCPIYLKGHSRVTTGRSIISKHKNRVAF
jgi:hypothetical protein